MNEGGSKDTREQALLKRFEWPVQYVRWCVRETVRPLDWLIVSHVVFNLWSSPSYFIYFDVLVQFDDVLFSLTFKCFWLKCEVIRLFCMRLSPWSRSSLLSSAAKSLRTYAWGSTDSIRNLSSSYFARSLSLSKCNLSLSLANHRLAATLTACHYKGGHSQFHSLRSRRLREGKWPDCSCCPYSSSPVKVSHS